MKNHYATLGLPRTATSAEIKSAYHSLSRRWHPDNNPDAIALATEETARINDAHDILSDPKTKADYDTCWELFWSFDYPLYPDPKNNVLRLTSTRHPLSISYQQRHQQFKNQYAEAPLEPTVDYALMPIDPADYGVDQASDLFSFLEST